MDCFVARWAPRNGASESTKNHRASAPVPWDRQRLNKRFVAGEQGRAGVAAGTGNPAAV
jgi:hypothetical protein